MVIRKASIKDIEQLVQLRYDFMLDEGIVFIEDEVNAVKENLRMYFQKSIINNSFIAFIAEMNGKAISTAFMTFTDRPPRMAYTSFLVGTLYNVFTYKEHRRKGIATKVLNEILEEGVKMGAGHFDLLATSDGEPLYEKLGFQKVNLSSMRK